jgi:alkylation response protein AidB-like acyl-CoA dehydrogenase
MSYGLSEEQEMFRQTLRKFCENELAAKASYWDEEQEFPSENVEKMKKLGLWGLTIPEEYGGSGADFVNYVTATIEIARVCGSTAVTFFLHNGSAIWTYGTEEQKRKYLPLSATGEKLMAWGQTEPGSGTDSTSMRASAVLKGDHYVLNGNKIFTTTGGVAEIYIVIARTDPTATKKSKGLSCFIVEKGFPGFSFGKEENKMGLRGSPTVELIFEDCQVPKENLLIGHPEAFRKMMILANGERLANSSCCIGIAEAAFEYSIKYVQQREAFGQKISDLQGIRWMLADMAIQIESAKSLLYRTARMIDDGLTTIKESCMTKTLANEMSQKVTNMAIQLLGGYGYMKDYPVERYFRDCRGLGFGGGTPQILRTVLANQLLKEFAV